jgi:hypothetical protein
MVTVIDLNLQDIRKRKHSQSGEEGIIDSFISVVYSEVEKEKLIVCEFGAHDSSNSNLLKIVEEEGSFGVFIECDLRRFESFQKKYGNLSNIRIIFDRVGSDQGNDLSSIFKRNGLAIERLKILSIDIDGDDVHVFESINENVDLVLIEYNPTFPFDVHYSNPIGGNIGTSPLALAGIAANKNMFLAALTETNLVFVNNKFGALIKKHDLTSISTPRGAVRFAMGYDGTLVVVDGNGVDLTDEVIGIGWGRSFFLQPLPKLLRKFDRLDRTRTLYSLIMLIVTRPTAVMALSRKYAKYLRES